MVDSGQVPEDQNSGLRLRMGALCVCVLERGAWLRMGWVLERGARKSCCKACSLHEERGTCRSSFGHTHALYLLCTMTLQDKCLSYVLI